MQDFDAYSQRVAELTANVARVYSSLAMLPTAPDEDSSTRVLWVSDIHNNPQTFTLMGQLVEQFDVAAIVDTGDIVDVGSSVENRLLGRIGSFRVPTSMSGAITTRKPSRNPSCRRKERACSTTAPSRR